MINNKFKLLIILLLTSILGIFIWGTIYLGMIPNPLDKYRDYSEKKKIEKQGINNYLNDLDSGKYDDYLFEETNNSNQENNSNNIVDEKFSNTRIDSIIQSYNKNGISDELLISFVKIGRTNLENLLLSNDIATKNKLYNISNKLVKYISERRVDKDGEKYFSSYIDDEFFINYIYFDLYKLYVEGNDDLKKKRLNEIEKFTEFYEAWYKGNDVEAKKEITFYRGDNQYKYLFKLNNLKVTSLKID